MPTPFTSHAVVQASGQQSSTDLGNEVAILNVHTGTYYGLDAVGARIWQLVQNPCRVSDIRDAIVNEYKVTAEQFETDLQAFLNDLEEAGLIERVSSDAA